eukprot:COSAG03_NODE_8735_length_775_cov_0.986686_1_plen_47_part_10
MQLAGTVHQRWRAVQAVRLRERAGGAGSAPPRQQRHITHCVLLLLLL